jgi:hypothetical protein
MFVNPRNIPTGGRSCHILAIADRYAPRECEGCIGANGKRQPKKLDIELDARSSFTRKLSDGKVSTVQCLDRLPGVTNGSKPGGGRHVKRKPAAKKRGRRR